MSEGIGTTDPVAAPAEPAAPTGEPTSYIGEDGDTLLDGWKGKYLSEDIRGEAVFDRAKTLSGLFKTTASAERMIGADKMVKPSDKFGDEDWDAYHAAGGWTNEPIPISAPEGLPEGIWSNERAKTYSDGFNKLRLNPKQVAGIMEMHNADLIQQITDNINNTDTASAQLKTDLLSEKGNAYTQFEHNGNVAIERGSEGESPEFKERIVKKYGNDPDIVRLLGNLGGRIGESGSVSVVQMAATPVDIEAKLDEIRNSDAFMKPTHPGHKAAMANVARLHEEKANIRQPL